MIAWGLFIQAVAMILQGLFCSQRARRIPFYALLSTVASAFLLYGYASVLSSGNSQSWLLNLPGLGMGAELIIDPLAAFLGLLFAFGFPLGLLYGHYYLNAHPGRGLASHNLFLGLMILSMHLVLMLRSSLLFMIAWEVMSLSSFLAILQDRDNKESVAAALYYFVMMQLGAAVLLLGFGLQFSQSGSLNLGNLPLSGWTKWLLLTGFAFKAGFFPFYSWLPKAHPVAPAHLSGMMSGLMIKTGIFGIILVLSHASWQPFEIYLLLAISLITAFNGVIHALAESNIKRSLAYSSIENIGIIGIGLSFWLLGQNLQNPLMATLGLTGALMHMLNHSLFKPLLFYLSGNILVQTHSLQTDKLGGLNKRMPRTAMLFIMGTAAISALPLFNGFISEFAIFLGILNGFDPQHLGSTLCAVTAGGGFAFVSALALIAFSKIFSISFGGEPRSEAAEKATESPVGMLISPALLASVSLLFGIFGRLALLLVSPVAISLGADKGVLVQFGHTLDGISIVLLILLACYITVYLLKKRLNAITYINTWSCGYSKASSRLQYTGTAYINPLAYFLKPLMHKSTSKTEVKGHFPTQMEYTEEVRDYVDRSLVQTLCKAVQRFYKLFDSIHNGRTNSYITYLLLALLVLLFWVLGVPK